MPDDAKGRPPDLPHIISRLAGDIVWALAPQEGDAEVCGSVVRALIQCGGDVEELVRRTPACDVRKFSYRKLIVRHRGEARQAYFKIFLPDFSWKWRRGLRCFRTPAEREAGWFKRVADLGVDVVDVLAVGLLPWRRCGIVQSPSFLVTASSLETTSLAEAVKAGTLSPAQRLEISRTITNLADALHGKGVGHLDMIASNVLYDPAAGRLLLCDLERTCRLPRFGKAHRIAQDMRKVQRTLDLLRAA